MFKRSFAVAAFGALALLLTAVPTSPAEFVPFMTFPVGRGGTIGAFGPTSYSYYPGSCTVRPITDRRTLLPVLRRLQSVLLSVL